MTHPWRSSWAALALGLGLALVACGGERDEADATADGQANPADLKGEAGEASTPQDVWSFPSGFLFGTATAGFQVDMGCPTLPASVCADVHSDWYAYMTDPALLQHPRTYLHGDDPAVTGPGHWELYPQDHALARNELHNNAFRMSLEWSRVFPESTVGIEGHEALRQAANPEALATYHAMFRSMKEHGLTPLVTLHHYALPLWIHDGAGCTKDLASCSPRGWLDRDLILPEIEKWAGFAAAEFGGEVDLWATENEPFAVVVMGFLQPNPGRSNRPAQMLDSADAKTALFTMIQAHARMADAVRAGDRIDADGDGQPARVGLVYAMAPVLPRDPASEKDVRAARNVFYLWNLLFLDAVALGQVDDDLDGTKRFDPALADRLDFVGLNYYQSSIVEGTQASLLPQLSPLLTLNPLTVDTSQVHPRGLYEMLLLLKERYGLPVTISENNGQRMAAGDLDGEIRNEVANLQQVLLALRAGVDVRGYFYWSLMDNIEWNHGASEHWGLYAVDPADPNKTRTPKALVPVYADIAEHRGVSAALREQYGAVDPDAPPTGGVPEANLLLPSNTVP